MNGLDRLRIVAGWVVLALWASSVLYGAVNPDYNPPSTIYLLMMVVVGALFGPKITGRDK